MDVLVQAGSRAEYYHAEDALRGLGFVQRHEPDDPVCRWTVEGIVVDLMPTEESVLGFGNRWYVSAIRQAARVTVTPSVEVRAITAPYFIATKLEAFQNRGGGDFLASRDIADIVSVVDGRPELTQEVAAAEESLRGFLSESFLSYLAREDFREAVAGHMLPDVASQRRVRLVLDRIRQMVRP